ncbi:hypothetical protein [Bacillus sp. FJAT-45066]|nr:hypothetical protein [Bacillus sp. FJAT-45066]
MEGKPLHYDGSIQQYGEVKVETATESFKLTEEMRANISGNPYVIENND